MVNYQFTYKRTKAFFLFFDSCTAETWARKHCDKEEVLHWTKTPGWTGTHQATRGAFGRHSELCHHDMPAYHRISTGSWFISPKLLLSLGPATAGSPCSPLLASFHLPVLLSPPEPPASWPSAVWPTSGTDSKALSSSSSSSWEENTVLPESLLLSTEERRVWLQKRFLPS